LSFPFVIDAQNEEELEKKASAWFCKKAEEFLAIPQVHEANERMVMRPLAVWNL